MSPQQQVLLEVPPPPAGLVVVNDRVSIRSEETHRVVCAHGVVLAHYAVGDRAAEAYAMVTLFELGYADQDEIARAFGSSTRSLRRYQERFESGGLLALGRPSGRPAHTTARRVEGRDRTILRLKERGVSNRGVAQRLGLGENSIRKRLRRLGWKPQPETPLPFPGEADDVAPSIVPRSAEAVDASAEVVATPRSDEPAVARAARPTSLDADPLDRSMDRLLAAMGRLEDAAPLFARADSLPGAGVLLAIPALVASGLLAVAREIYGTLGPSEWGTRPSSRCQGKSLRSNASAPRPVGIPSRGGRPLRGVHRGPIVGARSELRAAGGLHAA